MSIRKNYSFNVLHSALNILFPLLTFPYVSRLLAPQGIGQVQFALSFAHYFAIVAALGIPVYGVKEIARARNNQETLNQTFSELFVIHFISTLVILFLYFLSIQLLPDGVSNRSLLIIGSIIVCLGFLNMDWFFGGLEDFRFIALRSASIKFLALIGLFLLVKTHNDLPLYMGVLVFGFIGNYLVSAPKVFQMVSVRFRELDLRRHLSHLFFIFGTTFAATIYTNFDTILLGLLTDKYEVGYYTAAVKLAKVAIPFVTALGLTMVPSISKAQHESDTKVELDLLKKSFIFIASLSFPMFFGLLFLREELVLLFSGSAFLPSAIPMAWLSGLPVLIGFGYLFAYQILVPHNRTKGMMLAALVGLFVFLTLNFILTPEFGALGSAVSIVATELIVTILYFVFVPQYIRNMIPWSFLIKIVPFCLLFYPVIQAVKSVVQGPAMLVVMSSVLLCGLLYAFSQLVVRNPLMIEVVNIIKANLARRF